MATPQDENLIDSVAERFTQSNDELYEELTDTLLGVGFGLAPSDREGRRKFGRQWFVGRLDEFRHTVCTKDSVGELRDLSRDDELIAAATVADALIHAIGQPAAVLVAILILRLGLDAFCQEYW